jgi:DNA-directed RNA polymerase subunit K/omega
MDIKKSNAAVTTITRDVQKFETKTGNIYKSIAVISKRANQISSEIKEELDTKLEEFSSKTDTLEEVYENAEQIEISKLYERLPKPSSIATQEFIDGKIYFRDPDEKLEDTESK